MNCPPWWNTQSNLTFNCTQKRVIRQHKTLRTGEEEQISTYLRRIHRCAAVFSHRFRLLLLVSNFAKKTLSWKCRIWGGNHTLFISNVRTQDTVSASVSLGTVPSQLVW